MPTIWHGSEIEARALIAALERNEGSKLRLDQRTVDRLVFMRRIAERLWLEEACESPHQGVDDANGS